MTKVNDKNDQVYNSFYKWSFLNDTKQNNCILYKDLMIKIKRYEFFSIVILII